MDTKMHTIFLCTLRHTQAYAFTWSLSHTHSHVQTRTRVAAHCPPPQFLQEQADRYRGQGKAWTLQ